MNKTVFVILSFEGPDRYSHAGGLGSRVTELSTALASLGFETHLFFVGDPALPGHERREGGRLHLHRWCQWISRYHPGGVYDGEEGKLADWDRSLPAWLEAELLAAKTAAGDSIVVIAEEWHTARTIGALHERARRRGWLGQVRFLWNANNTFSFDRIDWQALKGAATITTVSRYMKHAMWRLGVDPLVVPNGIPERWLGPVDRRETQALAHAWEGRLALVKVARWDPDKRWEMAVDAVAELKALQLEPLLLARGGREEHGREVVARAERRGLRVRGVSWRGNDVNAVAEAIGAAVDADVLVLESYLNEPQRRALFRAADAVLANSGVEPFGLVGLETMAVGGMAFVGATGEDYVTPGHDAVSLQTSDPLEIVRWVARLRSDRDEAARMRAAARRSAARQTWESAIGRVLLPSLELGANGSGSRAAARWRATNGHPPAAGAPPGLVRASARAGAAA